jgi:Transglutaminase-like superfamily
MRSLKRLIHLPNRDAWLLFEAALTVVVIRIMLQCLPLRTVQRAAVDISRCWRSVRHCAPDRIVWAIEKAARLIAGSNCLVEALAGQALLVRYGYKPCLIVGVGRDEEFNFEGHAWVTSEDRILIGGRDASRYTTILTLGSLS